MLLSSCQDPGSPPVPGAVTETTTAPPAASASPSGSSSPSSGNPGVYKPADSKGKAENVPVPVMPELAKENSKEGLEAFIRYWFQLLSYAYETGDTARVAGLSSQQCALCGHLGRAVSKSYEDGSWMTGGILQTPVVEVRWDSSSYSQQAQVQLIQTEIRYFAADGTEHRELTGATNDAVAFFAEFRNDAWTTLDTGIIR
ncbi:DUF6318 family protein [Paenarthrobacter ureafaciens]|uniref:DUF6318 family protein n=2 Tax=Paenarthrobacter ureafaciens TaxID=37931 RepID=UPI0023EAC3F0|nr:DUF6318 family protein [Paenarthrobacter ureafaciens]